MSQKLIRYFLTHDKVSLFAIILTILIALVIVIFYLLNQSKLPSKIPLFYSLTWGETQLANLTQILILPLIILLITLVNITISWHLHSSQLILKRIIIFSTLLISVFLLITSFKIITIFV